MILSHWLHRHARWALTLAAALLLALPLWQAEGRSFRQFNSIPQPGALPEGAEELRMPRPVDRALVLQGVREILNAWNNGELKTVLAEDFTDAQILDDTIITTVPRDAELQLVALRAHNTLRQYLRDDPEDGRYRVSRVTATVRLQLVFTDPVTGYQRLPSTSEFIIDIHEPQP